MHIVEAGFHTQRAFELIFCRLHNALALYEEGNAEYNISKVDLAIGWLDLTSDDFREALETGGRYKVEFHFENETEYDHMITMIYASRNGFRAAVTEDFTPVLYSAFGHVVEQLEMIHHAVDPDKMPAGNETQKP